MSAPDINKTVVWTKGEFVEYSSVDKFSGLPERPSARKNVKVLHFLRMSLLHCDQRCAVQHFANGHILAENNWGAICQADCAKKSNRRL